MASAIVATKLYVPPIGDEVVLRPRLIDRLSKGLKKKLTLVSAPAGFGKTTLVSGWIATCGRPASWVSLDEVDSDATRFLTYLVAALQTVAPGIGDAVLGALQSAEPPPAESILTALLNEITALPDGVVLVLDDFHRIDAEQVDAAVTFLLDHLPTQIHLVIATREDPRLPLARLRARGQVTEIRAADLRFTASETAAFLTNVMGLGLSDEDLALLDSHTEGWIAGLQLAALSMRGREDLAAFTKAFTGSHRFVVDYLVEEVLQRQPARLRDFLLQTSILERLTGPLCRAVTGQEDSSAVLERLERGNFFIVPLDDDRRWFRYHHLFADVLSARLMVEQPDRLRSLHRRASEWYERNSAPASAIHHALAAKDLSRAASLIELAVPDLRRSRQESLVLEWIRAIPDEMVRCRPVLSVEYAWALLATGDLDAVEERLTDAERWLDRRTHPSDPTTDPLGDMVVVDEDEFRRLPGSIAVYRAGRAQMARDVEAAAKYARRALGLVPEDDPLMRGAAFGLLGLAYWTGGDLEAGHRALSEGMAGIRLAGYASDAIHGSIALADIRAAQGRLREARNTYEQAIRAAIEWGEPPPRGTPDLYAGLSELDREQNDLESAVRRLQTSRELGERTNLPRNHGRWFTAMAEVARTQGNLDGALGFLREAERLHKRDYVPDVRPVGAMKARVWLAQGRLGEALSWARSEGLSANDDLAHVHEFEHITVAQILVHEYENDGDERSMREAMELLGRLGAAAADGGRFRDQATRPAMSVR